MASKDGVPPGCPLTQHQYNALKLIATEGLTANQMAARLGIGQSSIRDVLWRAYRNLGVPGQTQAIALLIRNGWATWQPPPPTPETPLPPFTRAYLHCLDKWNASGRRDTRAEEGMRIAALGALRTREPDPRIRRVAAPHADHTDAEIAHIDGEDGYGHAHTGQ